MGSQLTGIAEKCSRYYWTSVERVHGLKILKYPLLSLLTLLFWIVFAIRLFTNGLVALKNIVCVFFFHTKQTDNSEQQSGSAHHKQVAALVIAVLLITATVIFLAPKLLLPTAGKPAQLIPGSSPEGNLSTANAAQIAISSPSELLLNISKPTLNSDGTYLLSVDVKASTADHPTAKLKMQDSGQKENTLCTFSGLTLGKNVISISKQSLKDLLPMSTPKNVIVLDTTSYVMAPNDAYGINVQLFGKSSYSDLSVYSSNELVAKVTKCTDNLFYVIGYKEGTCQIIFETNSLRASTQISVQSDITAHGNADRVMAAQ